MASITNYASLVSAIQDYLNRADLSAQIPMFIQFAEADLNTRLRTRQMIVRAVATSSLEYVAVPADYLEGINLQLTGETSPLRYVTLDEADIIIKEARYTSVHAYSIMDGAIALVPPPANDVEIEMVYYGAVPALSSSQTTNWLLTRAPDVYLYGALVHAAPYLMDDQRISVFGQFYSQRVSALNDESQKTTHSGSPLISKTRRSY